MQADVIDNPPPSVGLLQITRGQRRGRRTLRLLTGNPRFATMLSDLNLFSLYAHENCSDLKISLKQLPRPVGM